MEFNQTKVYGRQIFSVIALFLGVTFSPHVNAFVELSVFYGSDATKEQANASTGRTYLEGTIGFAIDKRGDYLVGWNYSSMQTTDEASGTTKTYTGTQMGPRFILFLDKAHAWTLGLGYYLSTQASYSTGGTADTWRGTALKADAGYGFEVTDGFTAGLRMNYSSATFTEKFAGGTTYSEVSYSKTAIYPSIYGIYMF